MSGVVSSAKKHVPRQHLLTICGGGGGGKGDTGGGGELGSGVLDGNSGRPGDWREVRASACMTGVHMATNNAATETQSTTTEGVAVMVGVQHVVSLFALGVICAILQRVFVHAGRCLHVPARSRVSVLPRLAAFL